MEYAWDTEKEKKNIEKHGLPLRAGIAVFEDPNVIEFLDDREDYGEDRYVLIGHDKRTNILYVCYTMRGHFLTLLISVRKATKREVQLYQSNLR